MRTAARRAEQTELPQSGATAEYALQTPSGAPHGKIFPVKENAFLCRAMRAEDVPACAAIEAAVPDGWSAAALAEELLQPTARLFVAEMRGSDTAAAQENQIRHIPFEADLYGGGSPAKASDPQMPDGPGESVEMLRQHAAALHAQPPNAETPDSRPASPIAALAVFQLVCEEANLYTVSTASALRRQGAARALLQYAFAQLAAQGVQTVFLEVRAQNSAARALYTALGFEQTGTRRSFYTKPADDAVLMQKSVGN